MAMLLIFQQRVGDFNIFLYFVTFICTDLSDSEFGYF